MILPIRSFVYATAALLGLTIPLFSSAQAYYAYIEYWNGSHNSHTRTHECNTDYEYKGEETRTAHHDYRLQLLKGAVRAANIYVKWYDWTLDLEDIVTGIEPNTEDDFETLIYPNPLDSHSGILNIKYRHSDNEEASIEINDYQGRLIYVNFITGDLAIDTKGMLNPGLYFITVKTNSNLRTLKLLVI